MNFYTQQHKQYCGIDLHARAMYVCILDQAGTILEPVAQCRGLQIATFRRFRRCGAVFGFEVRCAIIVRIGRAF